VHLKVAARAIRGGRHTRLNHLFPPVQVKSTSSQASIMAFTTPTLSATGAIAFDFIRASGVCPELNHAYTNGHQAPFCASYTCDCCNTVKTRAYYIVSELNTIWNMCRHCARAVFRRIEFGALPFADVAAPPAQRQLNFDNIGPLPAADPAPPPAYPVGGQRGARQPEAELALMRAESRLAEIELELAQIEEADLIARFTPDPSPLRVIKHFAPAMSPPASCFPYHLCIDLTNDIEEMVN
jgi:hypothetical protein